MTNKDAIKYAVGALLLLWGIRTLTKGRRPAAAMPAAPAKALPAGAPADKRDFLTSEKGLQSIVAASHIGVVK